LFQLNLAVAQSGGLGVYRFLELSPSAHISAVGSKNLATRSNDLSFSLQNPSLLNSEHHTHLSLNAVSYFAGIKSGQLQYAHHFQKLGTIGVGIQYLSYGRFDATDVLGNINGEFSAGDLALTTSLSKPLDSLFSIGANVKFIYSQLEEYQSVGIASDLGVSYWNHQKQLGLALVLRNFGSQLKPYRAGEFEPIRSSFDLGFSKKLLNAPFRFNVSYIDILNFDLTYIDPSLETIDPLTGEEIDRSFNFFEKTQRHFVLGLEVLLSENFYLGAGYDFKKRAELQLESKRSGVGISYGFGFKISKFNFSYSRSIMHLAAASNHISIGTSLQRFK